MAEEDSEETYIVQKFLYMSIGFITFCLLMSNSTRIPFLIILSLVLVLSFLIYIYMFFIINWKAKSKKDIAWSISDIWSHERWKEL